MQRFQFKSAKFCLCLRYQKNYENGSSEDVPASQTHFLLGFSSKLVLNHCKEKHFHHSSCVFLAVHLRDLATFRSYAPGPIDLVFNVSSLEKSSDEKEASSTTFLILICILIFSLFMTPCIAELPRRKVFPYFTFKCFCNFV